MHVILVTLSDNTGFIKEGIWGVECAGGQDTKAVRKCLLNFERASLVSELPEAGSKDIFRERSAEGSERNQDKIEVC